MNTTVNLSKQHELYLQLINTKPSIEPIPKNLRVQKRWRVAVNKPNARSQKLRNAAVETRYKSLLAYAKKLFDAGSHPVFERDFRYDNTESALAMHAYLTNSFYFSLKCDFVYNYQIEYAFSDCPHETLIRGLIDSLLKDLKPREVKLKPDYSLFYLNTLKVQDSKYITY